MIIYLKSIIFGVVQGITEFLPVSSSAHLALLHKIFLLPIENELAFDVALHFATLIAVVFYFRKDILMMIRSFLKSFLGQRDEFSALSWFIVLGTVPAGFAGWFFNGFFGNRFYGVFKNACKPVF